MKTLAILGSTGSIGRQALDVVDAVGDFRVAVMSAHQNHLLLTEQILRYRPDDVIVTDPGALLQVQQALPASIKTRLHGDWQQFAEHIAEVDIVVGGISGAAGIRPTLIALSLGKTVALANKETMVAAGDLVEEMLATHGGTIIPVDSEHSAIFQCLEADNPVEKILLTASGGPFRTLAADQFENITLEQALKHPNWSMGAKITIDSATMMNKGLEVIEAQRLFHVAYDQIEVLVHPGSVVHSLVQFEDGSVKAQLGRADMRLPIAYALSYPKRLPNTFERLDLTTVGALQFEAVRDDVFPAVGLAYAAGRSGGSMPAVLNAANEVAVAAFLDRRIGFTDIIAHVRDALERHEREDITSLEQLRDIDRRTRRDTEQRIENR